MASEVFGSRVDALRHDLGETVGKTVKHVGHSCDCFLIGFTDGSFCFLEAVYYEGMNESSIAETQFTDADASMFRWESLAAVFGEEKANQFAAYEKACNEKRQRIQDEEDKRQFEQLKAKFEKAEE